MTTHGTTERATEGTPDGRHLPTARQRRRPVTLLLALVFFFGPLVAFVLGARPQEIENRPLTDLPSASAGWSFFPDFTAWATDHLPLRGNAVRGNAALSEAVFGEAPVYGRPDDGAQPPGVPADDRAADEDAALPQDFPKVLEGKDGWLYFGADMSNLCRPTHTVPEVMQRLTRLAGAVEASGRRFVVTVAPDKSSLYPDELPDAYLGEDCARQVRDQFWDALEQTPPPGYVDLRGPLAAEQARTGKPLYWQTDTHWVPRAAAIYATTLAERLDPALAAGTDVVDAGPAHRQGDLGVLVGRGKEDEADGVQLRRTGVTPADLPAMPYSPETFSAESSSAPLFQPSTLLLGDSFTTASRGMVGQFFAHLTLLHNEVPGAAPQDVANLIADNDVVVYEVVERTIASGRGPLIDDASLAAIEATLAAHPR